MRVELLYHSNSEHLQQPYAGLVMLHRGGIIRLTQRYCSDPVRYLNDAPHLRGASHAHLDLIVDGRVRIHLDTHDAPEIALDQSQSADWYFKRSYAHDHVKRLPLAQQTKLVPLGLNYKIHPDGWDWYGCRRALRLSRRPRQVLAAIRPLVDPAQLIGFQPKLRRIRREPEPLREPRVLFLVAAYDPFELADRSPEKRQEIIELNEMRARCINALRHGLRERFTGGFIPSEFALRRYRGLCIAGVRTDHRAYLRMLQEYQVCVATTGLHGSTGWKFAEYVAFGKAVVSEALHYTLPGDFGAGRNYLLFHTPEQCAQAAERLIRDAELRASLMYNNYNYYRRYVRPDAMMQYVLDEALRPSGSLENSIAPHGR